MSSLIDIAFLGVLLISIMQAIRLNRRARSLDHFRQELDQLMIQLDRTLKKTSMNVQDLTKLCVTHNTSLSEKLPKLFTLQNDLDILLYRSEKAANKLEEKLIQQPSIISLHKAVPLSAIVAAPQDILIEPAQTLPAADTSIVVSLKRMRRAG